MGQVLNHITDRLRAFITEQKMFFVGTATEDSRINISPKGLDSLRVLSERRVIWLNLTGSGNETAAHIQENSRMTIMFAAYEGAPLILRLYGEAKVIHRNDSQWSELYTNFPDTAGARQIFDLSIDLVQTSCGMAVPLFNFAEERGQLTDWAVQKGEAGVEEYWLEKNTLSLDGKPTHIESKNT